MRIHRGRACSHDPPPTHTYLASEGPPSDGTARKDTPKAAKCSRSGDPTSPRARGQRANRTGRRAADDCDFFARAEDARVRRTFGYTHPSERALTETTLRPGNKLGRFPASSPDRLGRYGARVGRARGKYRKTIRAQDHPRQREGGWRILERAVDEARLAHKCNTGCSHHSCLRDRRAARHPYLVMDYSTAARCTSCSTLPPDIASNWPSR